MLHASGHFAGFIDGSSPAASVEGDRRPTYGILRSQNGRRVRLADRQPTSQPCLASPKALPA
jgi:hypothetical protein